MAITQKGLSDRDGNQVLKAAANDVNGSLQVDGFLVGKVGRKVERSLINPTTEDYVFTENGVSLYTIRVIYTDATLETIASAERTS